MKEEKVYDYWPIITFKVLQKKKDDKGSVLCSVPIPEDHPKNIASFITLKLIPKTSDLVEKAILRFSKE